MLTDTECRRSLGESLPRGDVVGSEGVVHTTAHRPQRRDAKLSHVCGSTGTRRVAGHHVDAAWVSVAGPGRATRFTAPPRALRCDSGRSRQAPGRPNAPPGGGGGGG